MSSIDHPSNTINSIMLTEQISAPATPPSGKQQLFLTSSSGLKLITSSGSVIPVSIVMSTPTSASATGVAGTVYFDSGFAYFCVATNTWKKVAIATW